MQPFGKAPAPNKKAKILWGGLLVVCLGVLAGAAWYSLLHQKPQRVEQALSAAQQVTLLLGTGEMVEGTLLPDKAAKVAAPPPAELPAEAAAPSVPTEQKENAVAAVEPTPAPAAPAPPPVAPEETVAAQAVSEVSEVAPVADTKEAALATPAVYAKNDKTPKIAIVIGGLGLSKSSTEQALRLPGAVTLGFSPYAHTLTDWFSRAKENGHESFLLVPMEPENYPAVDPGPFALLTELAQKENQKRLDWILSRGEGYRGVYTEADERFTESGTHGSYLLAALQKKGLPFVYGKGYRNNAFLQLAGGKATAMLVNDMVIDERISAGAIQVQLSRLEEAARKNGYAVAIGSPYPITLKLLEKWVSMLEAKGFRLVPVSQLAAPPAHE